MYTCFFIGHRDTPSWVQERLDETVAYLIRECQVTEFIVGYHGSFDAMATAAVQKAKRVWPSIYARRLLCYHPADKEVCIPELFDDFCYPHGMEQVPPRFAIRKANQLMADQSDYLVAYIARDGGNAAKIYARALRRTAKGTAKVINLAAHQSRTG